MPRPAAFAVPLVLAVVALAGCTPAPAPTATASSSSAPVGPVAPSSTPSADADSGADAVRTTCFTADEVAALLGRAVTASATGTPPASPVDAELPGLARTLCDYTLADGVRIGFEPLVVVEAAATRGEELDAFFAGRVAHDDCGIASGYIGGELPSEPATYYLWTGSAFAAGYELPGSTDPTDQALDLITLIDAAGYCRIAA